MEKLDKNTIQLIKKDNREKLIIGDLGQKMEIPFMNNDISQKWNYYEK